MSIKSANFEKMHKNFICENIFFFVIRIGFNRGYHVDNVRVSVNYAYT